MKKVVLTVLFLMVFVASASAYGLDKYSCDSYLGPVLNKCVSHPGIQNEYGIGSDLIFYEGQDGELLNKLTAEYRYDFEGEANKIYAVATVKLADLWSNLKSVFGQ